MVNIYMPVVECEYVPFFADVLFMVLDILWFPLMSPRELRDKARLPPSVFLPCDPFSPFILFVDRPTVNPRPTRGCVPLNGALSESVLDEHNIIWD
jgi:hypothetical protein